MARLKFAIWLAALFGGSALLVATVGALVFVGHEGEQRRVLLDVLDERGPLLGFLAFLHFFACYGLMRWLFARFVTPLGTLAAQTRIVAAANLEHRVAAASPETAELAAAINRLGDTARRQHAETSTKIADSNASVEEERQRLAALMSELSEGVLVSNPEGRILLYNEQARALFTPASQGASRSPVGLGRSVFAFLDRDQVTHAIDKIQYALDRERESPVTLFLATSASGGLVRVRVAPFLSRERLVAGFVLTLEDVTAAFGREEQRRSVLQALATGARQSAANVRAAAESLAAFPDMDEAQRARFTEIVAAESKGLSDTIDAALEAYAEALKAGLSLEDIRVADLLDVIRRRLEALPGATLAPNASDADLWVKVDSYALTQAFAFLALRLQEQCGAGELGLRAQEADGFAAIDFTWRGEPVPPETLGRWETEPLQLGAQQAPLSLHQVLEQHGGEVWHEARPQGEPSWFRFLVPLTEPATSRRRPIPRDGRPEYYDFDLFHQSGATEALMGRRLVELSYTVFDTETTGVEPSAGDRIISIGAVRIVNGRSLKGEVYEQLVNPERTVPRDSVRIHGIEGEALAGQPPLREVLPGFHRFCEDTVLVAHNAAFDMRFLELAEDESGVRFSQPVLDTLLLSAAVHPELEDHSIEAIAERLGIPVIGRHTSLGDALVTSEIFLRLVALLAERGVTTLGQALDASRETYYVRLQY